MSDFCIFRVQPLTMAASGKNSIGKALRHLDNHEKTARISNPQFSGYNCSFLDERLKFTQVKRIAKQFEKDHNNAIDQSNEQNHTKRRHMKKDSHQAFEVLLTFSPEMINKINLKEWIEINKNFLYKEFESSGCVPVRIEFHADETTPHISAIFIAWDNEKQNATTRNIIGGPQGLRELQDRYAQDMKEFNLRRGLAKTDKRVFHQTLDDYYKKELETFKNDLKAFKDDFWNDERPLQLQDHETR